VKISAVRLLVLLAAVSGVACSKSAGDDAFKNDLTGRTGANDDGVKPKLGTVIAPAKPNIPTPAPVARGGVIDDGVKPAPGRLPAPVARGGIADDGIKPAPGAPLPLPNTRGGVPDDSVKPGPGPHIPPK
jgi:hypothetical protein